MTSFSRYVVGLRFCNTQDVVLSEVKHIAPSKKARTIGVCSNRVLGE